MTRPAPLTQQQPGPKSALSVTEAAAYCGVSESYLNKARLSQRGPRFCRPPGCRRIVYRREDLERWLADGAANDE